MKNILTAIVLTISAMGMIYLLSMFVSYMTTNQTFFTLFIILIVSFSLFFAFYKLIKDEEKISGDA